MTTTRTDTLPALLDGLVAANPDAPIAYDIVDDVAVARSRGEFRDRVEAVRSELDGIGLRAGQCIAVMLPNWSDALVWQFAASALGAHVIGVNTRYNTREVAHILTAARPAVVSVPAAFHGLDLFGRLTEAAASVPDVATPVVAVVPGPANPSASPADFDLGGGAWTAGSGDTRDRKSVV